VVNLIAGLIHGFACVSSDNSRGGIPPGLSAAVYTASEGFSHTGHRRPDRCSSLIRKYLGFPRGTNGQGLATKAFAQLWSFGADTVIT
jgi:thioredoxin reductase